MQEHHEAYMTEIDRLRKDLENIIESPRQSTQLGDPHEVIKKLVALHRAFYETAASAGQSGVLAVESILGFSDYLELHQEEIPRTSELPSLDITNPDPLLQQSVDEYKKNIKFDPKSLNYERVPYEDTLPRPTVWPRFAMEYDQEEFERIEPW